MPSYIQIADDPTKWLVAQGISASQLTGQPLSITVSAPVVGTMVLSGKPAGVVISDAPSDMQPQILDVPAPAIYVPTAAGVSQGNAGLELPASADLTQLANQIVTSMSDGQSQAVTLGGNPAGQTLELDGATLPFVMLCMKYPPIAEEGVPHDSNLG